MQAQKITHIKVFSTVHAEPKLVTPVGVAAGAFFGVFRSILVAAAVAFTAASPGKLALSVALAIKTRAYSTEAACAYCFSRQDMEHVATIEVPINLTRVKSAEDYKIQLVFKSVAELLQHPVLDYCLLAAVAGPLPSSGRHTSLSCVLAA